MSDNDLNEIKKEVVKKCCAYRPFDPQYCQFIQREMNCYISTKVAKIS